MAVKYRVVPGADNKKEDPPAADDILDSSDGNSIQPLELEAARTDDNQHFQRRRRPRRFSIFRCFLVAWILVESIGFVRKRVGSGNAGKKGNEKEDSDSEAPSLPRMILCYGDSLTGGVSSQSGLRGKLYPYAEYLETELNVLYNSSDVGSKHQVSQTPAVTVRHVGLPGWTASSMVDHSHDPKVGICTVIQQNPTLSLVVILAGTNDIGQMTDVSRSAGRAILSSIVDLHRAAANCAKAKRGGDGGLRTLAVGVPGSHFQERVPRAAELTSYVNEMLGEFAASSGGNASYVAFPFGYRDDDPRWSEDGIHLTRRGYEELGRDLAPTVKRVLDGDGTP